MSAFSEGVGQTSLVIAAWRARESEQVDPLYCDPIANIFSDAEVDALVEQLDEASASTRHLINFRTRYFDDYLMREMNRGVAQVVLLGAGLDTRSLRLGHADVRFFEVDHRDVLRFKQDRLIRHGYTPQSSFIEGNYILDDFLGLLEQQGYDPGLETYFIWEGNSMYIPEQAIVDFLCLLNDRVHRFRISFDYLSKTIIERSTGYAGVGALLNGFAAMDAAWVTGFDEILPLAEQTNLELLENKWMIDVIEPSSTRVAMDRDLFRYYSVCTLSGGAKRISD